LIALNHGYPVAHLRGGGAKGANAPGGKFLGAAKYSNFYYDVFMIFLIFTPFSVLFSILKKTLLSI
jgi:hypothetical protein